MSAKAVFGRILVTLACAVVTLSAQQSARPTFIVSGVVVDGDSGAPIEGAHVQARWPEGLPANMPELPAVETGRDGRFALSLPEGDFTVVARKTGYADGLAGRRRPLGAMGTVVQPGKNRDDVRILMWRGGGFRGVVIDESNRPVANVTVHAWPRAVPSGFRTSATTDAEGVFRFSDLPVAEYVVALNVGHLTQSGETDELGMCRGLPLVDRGGELIVRAGRAAAGPLTLCRRLSQKIAPPEARNDARRTYESAFYPGVANLSDATPVKVSAGEERAGVVMPLRVVPGVRVRGKVISRSGTSHPMSIAPTLWRSVDQPPDLPDATAFLATDGTFTFLDVPPGHYWFLVHSQSNAREGFFDVSSILTKVPVDVGPAGVDDLTVQLVEAVPVRGRVVFKGSSQEPDSAAITLISAQPDLAAQGIALAQNGRFEMGSVVPGRYVLIYVGSDQPYSVEAMTAGGRDVTASPVEVGSGGISDIVITMTDRPASLSGTVVESGGAPSSDAVVVLFPTDQSTWTGANDRLPRFIRIVPRTGRFQLPAVIPGEYFVAALDERDLDDWPSLATLKQISARATRLRIAAAARQEVTLPRLRLR